MSNISKQILILSMSHGDGERRLRVAVSTGRRNTCVTPICWSLDAPVRGQLVISRRSRVRHTLAHLSSAPLLASSGRLAPLSLSLRDFDVSFNFISIHTIFCVFVTVLHRPIETAVESSRSALGVPKSQAGRPLFPIAVVQITGKPLKTGSANGQI